jgi:hypothetical protein
VVHRKFREANGYAKAHFKRKPSAMTPIYSTVRNKEILRTEGWTKVGKLQD